MDRSAARHPDRQPASAAWRHRHTGGCRSSGTATLAEGVGRMVPWRARHGLSTAPTLPSGGHALEPGREKVLRLHTVMQDPLNRRGADLTEVTSNAHGRSARRTGLVGLQDGNDLELKCPMPPTHLLWLARGGLPAQPHRSGASGKLWVSGREWCDFMSYHPQLPPLLVRG